MYRDPSQTMAKTRLTSDINGALGDTVKYSAYGEIRTGGTATDYLYTSQRNEAEIGQFMWLRMELSECFIQLLGSNEEDWGKFAFYNG